MEKCHGCSQEPSSLRRFFWAPRTNIKMDGFESFSNIKHIVWSVGYLKSKWLRWNWAVFIFTNGKMSWMLMGAVSLETVLLGIQDIVKMDGFESFSNIIHIVWSLWCLKSKWLHWNFLSSLPNWRRSFYLRMEICHGCSQEPSPLERFFWTHRISSVKQDGFEGVSNITHADLCDI